MTTYQTFESWLAALNRIIERKIGLSLDDLEDFCTRDGYDDGSTPAEFYAEVIAPEIGME